MARLRVHAFSISLDGYGAGPDQDLDNPIGVGGRRLHEWMFATRTFAERFGLGGGEVGIDDDVVRREQEAFGATIVGRNMFGPVRGPWPDDSWTGWWGDEPPFGHPVFVLTHHPRDPVTMAGGTTFHFVTGGIHEARDRAVEAANGLDVRIGGGVATIQQYLAAGLIDEVHLAVVPVLLGAGERLFDTPAGDVAAAGYACTELVASAAVAHVRLTRTGEVA